MSSLLFALSLSSYTFWLFIALLVGITNKTLSSIFLVRKSWRVSFCNFTRYAWGGRFMLLDSCRFTASFVTALDPSTVWLARCLLTQHLTKEESDLTIILQRTSMSILVQSTLYADNLSTLHVPLQSGHSSLHSWRRCELPFPHSPADGDYKDVLHFGQSDERKMIAWGLICISLIPKWGWASLRKLIRYPGFLICEVHPFCNVAVCLWFHPFTCRSSLYITRQSCLLQMSSATMAHFSIFVYAVSHQQKFLAWI